MRICNHIFTLNLQFKFKLNDVNMVSHVFFLTKFFGIFIPILMPLLN